MKIENVKGGYNYLPKEQNIRKYINNVLIDTFEKYGYMPVETPILTYYDILSDKYDENNDILKEIYKLSDQGDRKLGLRYDLTVPFAKLIALNKNIINYPFKRYEISKVFRDGPIKKGRDREFTQCDVDVVGIEGQLIEAELMKLYIDAFNKLGIEIIIKYNSRKLMSGLILECGIDNSLVSKTITIIDKMEKVSKEELNEMLISIGLTNIQSEKLLELFNLSIDELNNKFKSSSNEILNNGLNEINNLNNYIDKLNISDYLVFTSTLARGQDYYTGNVFEVYEKNNKLTSSIGGGGRYDNMITEFINDENIYPAVGISFGLTSLYELLKDKDIDNLVDVYIIPMGTDIECLDIASSLRDLGYKVELDFKNRKIKKSMEYANKEGIPYVIVIGENEVKSGSFNLKEMNSGNEYKIDIKEIEKITDYIK